MIDEFVKVMKLIVFLCEVGYVEVIIGFCIESKFSFFRGGDRIILLVDSFFGKCVGVKMSIK